MTTIAAVAAPFDHDLETCFARIGRILTAARARGAELVVFPECALGGYIREPGAGESAPVVPRPLGREGPELARLAALAGDLVVCMGYTEAAPEGRHSSAICLTGDGVLGHHRKVHLPPTERFAYTPGDAFAAFDTPLGRVGMLVCYDKLFPEAARALALDGAAIVACLAAWPVDRHRPAKRLEADRQTRHFRAIDVARAVENQVVWVSANQTGRFGTVRFLGNAQVVDPDGVVLARTRSRDGLAVADVEVGAAIDRARLHVDHLTDRRPAAYGAAHTTLGNVLADRPAG